MSMLFPARAGVILTGRCSTTPCATLPRTRGGDPLGTRCRNRIWQLFPARAGVIPQNLLLNGCMVTLPRTRGGDPQLAQYAKSVGVSSPHARG